jgi:membrane protein implicated in regulation of membrane protease activity
MRSRVFIINPPRSALARTLWLLALAALAVVALLFGAVIVVAAALLFGLAWLVRRVIRPRQAVPHPAAAENSGAVIEGEFVVVENERRQLP